MTSKPTVLIVDDSAFSIELLAAFLGERFDICFAMSGTEAVEIAPGIGPDLVILDVVLPDLAGYDVCRRLRREPCLVDVPIIFSSGNGDADAREQGRLAGGTDFLPKPVRAASLREMVARYIGRGAGQHVA